MLSRTLQPRDNWAKTLGLFVAVDSVNSFIHSLGNKNILACSQVGDVFKIPAELRTLTCRAPR